MLFVFESAVSDLVEPTLRISTGSSVDTYIKLHSQQQNSAISKYVWCRRYENFE